MTDEQINAAIAEACGWKGNLIDRDMEGNLWPSEPPNYCTDLNAMHEAERVLSKAQWEDFVQHLANEWINVSDAWKDVCHATSRQRAEAFLRTLGKWEATTEQSSVDHLRDATKMMEAQP